MDDFEKLGGKLRDKAKDIVLSFMKSTLSCNPDGEGIKQSAIFRECGLDWGDYENALSTNQQYWLIALLRELEAEKKIKRDNISKQWRLV